MSRRPVIALAMMEGLRDAAFRPDQLDRLADLGHLVDREPLTEFTSDRAAEVLRTAEVLVGHWGCPTLTADVVAKAPALELFAYAAGTVKWQVVDATFERGLIITSAAAANARPVAEFTVGAIMLANKGAFLAAAAERGDLVRFDRARIGNLGKRIGLVGASFVGRQVIELLQAMSMDLQLGVADPYLSRAEADRLGVELMELDALCEWCDVLSLHAPLVDATRNLLGAPQLALLRDQATIINTARGALIEPEALLDHLQSGRLSAILDVTDPEPLPKDHPLRRLPNVVLTPHLAGAEGQELWRLADCAIDEVERFVTGMPPRYPVRREDLERIA